MRLTQKISIAFIFATLFVVGVASTVPVSANCPGQWPTNCKGQAKPRQIPLSVQVEGIWRGTLAFLNLVDF